uniref:Uncharacterized protein n=1 Tax=Panagrolaimus sp. JU765 TaxID=591449 RepID=A0AC34QHR2_9BILA
MVIYGTVLGGLSTTYVRFVSFNHYYGNYLMRWTFFWIVMYTLLTTKKWIQRPQEYNYKNVIITVLLVIFPSLVSAWLSNIQQKYNIFLMLPIVILDSTIFVLSLITQRMNIKFKQNRIQPGVTLGDKCAVNDNLHLLQSLLTNILVAQILDILAIFGILVEYLLDITYNRSFGIPLQLFILYSFPLIKKKAAKNCRVLWKTKKIPNAVVVNEQTMENHFDYLRRSWSSVDAAVPTQP